MSAPILSLRGVETRIGRYHILHGVEFDVPEGGLTMLLGRNGAGKTTTLRTIMGLWRASAGEIRFAGRDITRMSTPEIAMLGIAYVPESMAIFADLTVRENLVLAARQGPPERKRLEWIFARFSALERFWHLPAGHLSGGQKQMLAVARAIVEPRRLLLVDEPTKGLAPAIVANMIEAFRELKDGATSLLVVEQNFAFARRLGNGVAVMDDGRVAHTGDMAQFAADDALQQHLLGLGMDAHQ
ncbi:MAG: ATP-binding cassette domain-containing protein [Alphaproteobacteria bacterium]|nr:ATP-binding cassette domain-containing protein [Alphaproteobacteria bacterium]